MDIAVTRTDQFLRVQASGVADLPSFVELIQALARDTRAHGDQRLLIDLLQVRGELNFMGHFRLGELVVRNLSHLARLASVVPPDKITRTSEKVARAQGVQLRVFTDEAEALAWLLAAEAPEGAPAGASAGTSEGASEGAGAAATTDPDGAPLMDPVRAAFWQALRHLFPPHAQAVQLANGNLAISWAMTNDPDALYEMSTPITIRFEPELVEHMKHANAAQRQRMAAHHETAFRAGMMGYDPYAAVPKARVIVLG